MSLDATIFAVVDLPAGSIVSVDGHPVAVKRDDFVGFSSIPTASDDFHFVTVQAGAPQQQSIKNHFPRDPSAVTVGFCLGFRNESPIVRRYDPKTEEVSSSPVDEATTRNLLRQLEGRQLGPERVVSYHRFVSRAQTETWRELTNYVSERLLRKRGIATGAKLVAGSSFAEEEEKKLHSESTMQCEQDDIVDGKAVSYPSIPVINPSGMVRHSRHLGTKRFMAGLSASQRTALFTDANPTNFALELILKHYYDNKWEDILGDVQLAYVLFSFLHCFLSLCHWRDLIAMLSAVDLEQAAIRSGLYAGLCDVLSSQLKTLDQDFFDDMQFSDKNCLLPSLQRLMHTLSRIVDGQVKSALTRFQIIVADRFSSHFQIESPGSDHHVDGNKSSESGDEDEDGPIVVSTDEVEASLARSSSEAKAHRKALEEENVPREIRQRFPFLFAAMRPNEDVVMTCARALDSATDVTLVREAAAYLEEIEAHKTNLL